MSKRVSLKLFKNRIVRYSLIIVLLVALGLPTRTAPQFLPTFYVQYAGDFLWAMLVYFMFASIFRSKSTIKITTIALCFAYGIELSQLFHPAWLDYLRTIKIFSLVLGHGFLFTDIIAYTLGISLASIIDWKLLREE